MRRLVPLGGLIGSILITLPGMGQPTASHDEQILRAVQLPTDNAGLLAILRGRASRGAGAALAKLVEQLGSDSVKEREAARQQLLWAGPAALPFLRSSVKQTPLEVVRRAEPLIAAIEAMGPEVPVAAARLLADRHAEGAVDAFLTYLPGIGDEWVEEEVLACLGQLTIAHDHVDARLLATLRAKDPDVRAAGVYVLGRRAGGAQRQRVRSLLADPDPQVRQRAALGLTGKRLPQIVRDSAAHDDDILKKQFGLVDETTLLAFLRQRTLTEDDQQRLRRWIRDLGHPKFAVRNEASRRLVQEGTPALALLAPALASTEVEVARRARLCDLEIRKGPGPALPIAIMHWLARASGRDHSPDEAQRVLLDYLPFADDDNVDEAAVNVLTILATRTSSVHPSLSKALADPQPARRGAAALVLGRVGEPEHLAAVRKLLDDPLPAVRLRAAQGLLAARDKVAIPPLIALLRDAPPTTVSQVEDQLQRLAGELSPRVLVGAGAPAARAKACRAWEEWWLAHAATLDLARADETHAFLGLITICEYDNANGMPAGQIWETARTGDARWTVTGFLGAMDAHLLPSGNVLVAENSANRVTERTKDGSIKWEYRLQGNPIACQRLPNGNTFIAAYNHVMEVDAHGRTIYNHQRGPAFYIFSAHKTKSGKIVCMTAQGAIVEIDAATGKELRTINLGPNGGWCSAEALPTGRYLVATMNNNLVREVDAYGKIHWQASFPGVFRATRLPNGNTVVASMTTKRVAELDRNGQVRWEKTCEGRPWSVHWR